ncbi:hypothetical protein BDY19DRAFT_918513 [Irpex rosettiformis]|uniref:Uncharacterized protein n=1 Tax=Irpex rosettiformis TaxID=378272 RepID=A0ACB8UH23_9APHY|nr:hypothetical protein BDY19DRAFT_918513 [Irpex rosettiformis]
MFVTPFYCPGHFMVVNQLPQPPFLPIEVPVPVPVPAHITHITNIHFTVQCDREHRDSPARKTRTTIAGRSAQDHGNLWTPYASAHDHEQYLRVEAEFGARSLYRPSSPVIPVIPPIQDRSSSPPYWRYPRRPQFDQFPQQPQSPKPYNAPRRNARFPQDRSQLEQVVSWPPTESDLGDEDDSDEVASVASSYTPGYGYYYHGSIPPQYRSRFPSQ